MIIGRYTTSVQHYKTPVIFRIILFHYIIHCTLNFLMKVILYDYYLLLFVYMYILQTHSTYTFLHHRFTRFMKYTLK